MVVLAAGDYERLRHLDEARAPRFLELLLGILQDGGEFDHIRLTSRPLDF